MQLRRNNALFRDLQPGSAAPLREETAVALGRMSARGLHDARSDAIHDRKLSPQSTEYTHDHFYGYTTPARGQTGVPIRPRSHPSTPVERELGVRAALYSRAELDKPALAQSFELSPSALQAREIGRRLSPPPSTPSDVGRYAFESSPRILPATETQTAGGRSDLKTASGSDVRRYIPARTQRVREFCVSSRFVPCLFDEVHAHGRRCAEGQNDNQYQSDLRALVHRVPVSVQFVCVSGVSSCMGIYRLRPNEQFFPLTLWQAKHLSVTHWQLSLKTNGFPRSANVSGKASPPPRSIISPAPSCTSATATPQAGKSRVVCSSLNFCAARTADACSTTSCADHPPHGGSNINSRSRHFLPLSSFDNSVCRSSEPARQARACFHMPVQIVEARTKGGACSETHQHDLAYPEHVIFGRRRLHRLYQEFSAHDVEVRNGVAGEKPPLALNDALHTAVLKQRTTAKAAPSRGGECSPDTSDDIALRPANPLQRWKLDCGLIDPQYLRGTGDKARFDSVLQDRTQGRIVIQSSVGTDALGARDAAHLAATQPFKPNEVQVRRSASSQSLAARAVNIPGTAGASHRALLVDEPTSKPLARLRRGVGAGWQAGPGSTAIRTSSALPCEFSSGGRFGTFASANTRIDRSSARMIRVAHAARSYSNAACEICGEEQCVCIPFVSAKAVRAGWMTSAPFKTAYKCPRTGACGGSQDSACTSCRRTQFHSSGEHRDVACASRRDGDSTVVLTRNLSRGGVEGHATQPVTLVSRKLGSEPHITARAGKGSGKAGIEPCRGETQSTYPSAEERSCVRLIAGHGLTGAANVSAVLSAVLLTNADPDAVKGACELQRVHCPAIIPNPSRGYMGHRTSRRPADIGRSSERIGWISRGSVGSLPTTPRWRDAVTHCIPGYARAARTNSRPWISATSRGARNPRTLITGSGGRLAVSGRAVA